MAQTTAAYASSNTMTSNNPNDHLTSRDRDTGHSTRDRVAAAIDYQPSPEERAVLRDCQSDSFWYAALPGSVAVGTVLGVMAKSGTYFKATGRFGALPHIATGMFVGYIGGKVSYIKKCEDMLLSRAPNSVMAQAIRARNEGRAMEYPSVSTHAEIMGVGPATRSVGGMRGDRSAGGGGFDTNLFGWGGTAGGATGSAAKPSQTSSQYQSPSNEEYVANVDVDFEQASARNEVEDYHASNYDFDKKPMQQGKPGLLGDDARRGPTPHATHSYDELRRYNRDTYYHPQQAQQQPQQQQVPSSSSTGDRMMNEERAPSTFEMLTSTTSRGENRDSVSQVPGSDANDTQQQRYKSSTAAVGNTRGRVNQYGDPIVE